MARNNSKSSQPAGFNHLMHWIAPSEQAVPAPRFAEMNRFNSALMDGLLGLILLRLAEIRFAARRAGLATSRNLG